VERAVQALAALNSPKRPEAQGQRITEPLREVKISPEPMQSQNRAACGSVHCVGCYEVEPGVRIHPPTSSEEWKEWLLKWVPKGKVQ
jgi:uncharacterized protein CbrC (UPF0167 family)